MIRSWFTSVSLIGMGMLLGIMAVMQVAQFLPLSSVRIAPIKAISDQTPTIETYAATYVDFRVGITVQTGNRDWYIQLAPAIPNWLFAADSRYIAVDGVRVAWSPDQRQLLFLAARRDHPKTPGMFLLDVETGQIQTIKESVKLPIRLSMGVDHLAYGRYDRSDRCIREDWTITHIETGQSLTTNLCNPKLSFAPDGRSLVWSESDFQSTTISHVDLETMTITKQFTFWGDALGYVTEIIWE